MHYSSHKPKFEKIAAFYDDLFCFLKQLLRIIFKIYKNIELCCFPTHVFTTKKLYSNRFEKQNIFSSHNAL